MIFAVKGVLLPLESGVGARSRDGLKNAASVFVEECQEQDFFAMVILLHLLIPHTFAMFSLIPRCSRAIIRGGLLAKSGPFLRSFANVATTPGLSSNPINSHLQTQKQIPTNMTS